AAVLQLDPESTVGKNAVRENAIADRAIVADQHAVFLIVLDQIPRARRRPAHGVIGGPAIDLHPLPALPRAVEPSAATPMKLPSTVFELAAIMRTPSPAFGVPAITLRWAAVVPPTRLPVVSSWIKTPTAALPSACIPSAVVPIRFPWTVVFL